MPAKPTPPAPVEPTPEEAAAARLARQEAHRNRRPRHSFDDPLVYQIVGVPEATNYDVSGIPRATGPADDIPVRHVRN
jgi:hypothetical protein